MNGSQIVKMQSYLRYKNLAEELGMQICTLFDEYKSRKPIEILCKSGHKFSRMPQVFIKNQSCPQCKGGSGIHLPLEEILKKDAFKGFTYLGGDYKDQYSILDWKCRNGHLFRKYIKNFGKCPSCGETDGTKLNESLIKEGYKPLTEIPSLIFYDGYRHQESNFKVQCSEGHIFEVDYRGWFELKYRCPTCAHSRNDSAPENDVRAFVSKELGLECKRITLEKFHYDVCIEKYKILIDLHGIYYHSDARQSDYKYHYRRYEIAKRHGYHLFQIWEDEWYASKHIVKSIIKAKLGINQKVFARDTKLLRVPNTSAIEFLDKNHLLGSPNHAKYIGLYQDSKLLMLLGIAQHHRMTSKLVINRVCTLAGVTVVGGFSKLLAKCPRPLITWSDNRWSQGNLYQRNGFINDGVLEPDYEYVRGSRRLSKQSLRKTEEEKGLEKTELTLRLEQGYHRIYDAGKIRWYLSQ